MKQLIYIIIFFTSAFVFAQQDRNKMEDGKSYYIKGEVLLKNSGDPLSDVEVQVYGGNYTKTSLSGNFRIKAKIGDEIVISHPSIETVSYTLKNKDDQLKIYIEEPTLNKKIRVGKTSV